MNSRATPALLDEIGRRLYGENFVNQLARDLDVTPRRLRYWLAGENVIPSGVKADLKELVFNRAYELLELVEKMESEDGNENA